MNDRKATTVTDETEVFLRTLLSHVQDFRLDVENDMGERAGLPRYFNTSDIPAAAAHAVAVSARANVQIDLPSLSRMPAVMIDLSQRDFVELASFVLPPSMVVQYRHAPHVYPAVYAYWVLDEPCGRELDRITRALAQCLRGDRQPPRSTPLPGTLLYLPETQPMEVKLADCSDHTYSARELWSAACPVGA
jgi:hypothetical protein